MYNKLEIEKNLNLFINSLEEVLIKLDMNPENQILQERAEVTLALGEFALNSLERFHDFYIDSVKDMLRGGIKEYSARYKEIIGKTLKPDYHLSSA